MVFRDMAPQVAGTVITLATLAYIMFGLRCYTRLTKATWGVDDWCMTAAMVPFTVLTISCLAASFSGVGVHEGTMSNHQISEGLKWFFFFEVFYCATIVPIKLSIAYTLLRIASGQKLYRWSMYFIIGLFTTMNVIAAIYIIAQCTPVSYAWDESTPGGHCNDASILADVYYATTAVNIVTDWFCALLPVPLLWNVKLNRNAKISVGGILGLGVFASLSACIRLKYTINIQTAVDYTFGVADIVIWGYAENGIGAIVGCISTLRPLFRHLFNLGADSTDPTPNFQKYGWPSNARGTYKKDFDNAYELPEGAHGETIIRGGPKGDRSGNSGSGRNGSLSSLDDSESQKQILGDRGIMVTSHVNVSHDV
ncbi:hypothetical protein K490DRAFT_47413 [Saccharata proteae CBS 121410]|uniref:Rhodopsin domain-containing protein n=1 Tax=Saccharata proteae CBS 121410 TaxID=1314787 RepID=A0A9P4LXK8_9PEZI|nr:hypothetical protein K490DRAFT_47413 [Saccharata proteae CBS 121410]